MTSTDVAIVDYGMGNLFSVLQACRKVGLAARITSSPKEVVAAAGAILPGVGAFGEAITSLKSQGLDAAVREVATQGKPLMGVCLGLQLLMSDSAEFGRHKGLGLIEGSVKRLPAGHLKVPNVGWSEIRIDRRGAAESAEGTAISLLREVRDSSYMYFVHSYYVTPESPDMRIATARHGELDFCAAVGNETIFACQFHPEKSGPEGLQVYANFRDFVANLGSH